MVKTYGEFVAAVKKTPIHEARHIVEEWEVLATAEEWEKYRPMPLTRDLITNFAEDMAALFKQRLDGISTEALYERIHGYGHTFLQWVHAKAVEFGIEVEMEEIDLPITFTDALIRGQREGVAARNG